MNARLINETKKIWDAFLEGDDKSFAVFYFLHISRLLAYGKKFEAETEIVNDAIQDVFVDLYENRRKLSGNIENPIGYLMVSLRNNIFKKKAILRKGSTHTLSHGEVEEFKILYSFQDNLINQEINIETLNKLRRAIQNLTSGQKEVIYLRFEEGLSYQEISRIMEISVESVRKQVFRAISSLRSILATTDFYTFFTIILKKS
jgi:RNA polymerase sigma factor (sigma-70 family)